MFSLSFVQAGFLFAGLAAAIPILIHLLLKQRARRLDIGSVRFLQKVLKEHNRMRRLREWLLLAARVVTALLLALLFARPFFDQSALDAGQREIVFLLDQSASMQFEKDGKQIFQQAYEALQEEIEQVHDQIVVRVATFDSLGVSEIDWEKRVSPEPSFAGTDYAKALAWARDLLQKSTRPEQEIILFTDLQQSGLGQSQLGDFPPTIEVKIRDFGQSITRNRSITDVVATAIEIRPKMPPEIEVDVRNGSPVPIDNVTINLKLVDPQGKAYEDSQKIDILGGDVGSLRFQIESAMEGIYAGSVTVESKDELAFDNIRYVAFEARHPDRILLVDGEEGSSVYGDETYYLQTALQVGEEQSSREIPSYEIERIVWDNGKGFPDLAGFRAIVLANVGSFTTSDANRLKSYLDKGGRVLFFCGDKFSRRAAKPLVEAGILPGNIDGTASLGPYRPNAWAKDHPVFQPFTDPQFGDLRSIRFQKLAMLELPDSDKQETDRVQVLASTSDGKPLLVEKSFGPKKDNQQSTGKQRQTGKVLIWTTTADVEWTNWPQGRMFVPIVRQLTSYVTDHHMRLRQTEDVVAARKPGIKREGKRILVANVDTLESELTRTTPEEFRKSLNLPETKKFSDLTPEELASLAPPPGSLRPEEIWQTIAWILLGWLIIETFLAGRVHA